jgi:hypothetical protein
MTSRGGSAGRGFAVWGVVDSSVGGQGRNARRGQFAQAFDAEPVFVSVMPIRSRGTSSGL